MCYVFIRLMYHSLNCEISPHLDGHYGIDSMFGYYREKTAHFFPLRKRIVHTHFLHSLVSAWHGSKKQETQDLSERSNLSNSQRLLISYSDNNMYSLHSIPNSGSSTSMTTGKQRSSTLYASQNTSTTWSVLMLLVGFTLSTLLSAATQFSHAVPYQDYRSLVEELTHVIPAREDDGETKGEQQDRLPSPTSKDTSQYPILPHNDEPRLGDGCHHVFIDVGANLGVHGRFLMEPEKYPNAAVAQSIFGTHFGPERDNRDFCIFAFEPNPVHVERHRKLQAAYEALGWQYTPILAGVSDQAGNLTFYHQDDGPRKEWGFGVSPLKGDKSVAEVVPVIRLATWLQHHIANRQLPSKVYGTHADNKKAPKVVMKMDIESMEFMVLPDLLFSGALCQTVDFAFGEIHVWQKTDFDAHPITKKGGLHLSDQKQREVWRDGLLQAFHSLRSEDCKTTQFSLEDDETYLHDRIPLPKAGDKAKKQVTSKQ